MGMGGDTCHSQSNPETPPDPSRSACNPSQSMIAYESPFNEEFIADGEYWNDFQLPWNEEDEDLNIESFLNQQNDF